MDIIIYSLISFYWLSFVSPLIIILSFTIYNLSRPQNKLFRVILESRLIDYILSRHIFNTPSLNSFENYVLTCHNNILDKM